jgi:hypothetical protein
VRCLACGALAPRAQVHERLVDENPGWLDHAVTLSPDGDADLSDQAVRVSRRPVRACGGNKPNVVFFGGTVGGDDDRGVALFGGAGLLVVGSSLTGTRVRFAGGRTSWAVALSTTAPRRRPGRREGGGRAGEACGGSPRRLMRRVADRSAAGARRFAPVGEGLFRAGLAPPGCATAGARGRRSLIRPQGRRHSQAPAAWGGSVAAARAPRRGRCGDGSVRPRAAGSRRHTRGRRRPAWEGGWRGDVSSGLCRAPPAPRRRPRRIRRLTRFGIRTPSRSAGRLAGARRRARARLAVERLLDRRPARGLDGTWALKTMAGLAALSQTMPRRRSRPRAGQRRGGRASPTSSCATSPRAFRRPSRTARSPRCWRLRRGTRDGHGRRRRTAFARASVPCAASAVATCFGRSWAVSRPPPRSRS